MNVFGLLGLLSGGLQLVVPTYGLRLVRRFGAQSVGWFLVIAFSSLALLHVFASGRSGSPNGFGFGLSAEAVCAIASLLLLVGMGHLETVFSEREQGHSKEESICGQWASRVKAETADLVRRNHELAEGKTRCEQQLKVLEASEKRYRLLFDEHPQPMWVFDLRNHRVLLANAAALRQYGFTSVEFTALSARDLLSSESTTDRFHAYVAQRCSGTEPPVRWQHRRKDQQLIDVEMSGCDLRYDNTPARLVLAADLSSRRQRETEARNAVRCEVIGQVAGGFAHHFNNLLAVIEGNASVLSDEQTDPKSAGCLKNISAAVNRAAGLTRQLILAGGRRPVHVAAANLNALLRNSNHLLRRIVGNQVAIQNLYDVDLPLVLVDAQLMEQVVVNLVLNARDAMPSGGTITISTSTVLRKDAPLSHDGQVRTGEFVRLIVRDTGCGMTPEVRARLFEPFFTTKEINRASGLGLASVYGALKEQSGWLEFTSEPGKGTECRVFLPCAPASATLPRGEPQSAAVRGTILLVEPDDRTRNLARCTLNWNGYRVIETDGSAMALLLSESQAASIDLLFVDNSCSDGLTAGELANRLRESRPKLKVLLTSASESGDDAEEGDHNATPNCVSKPYRPEQLLEAVQIVLTGDTGHA